MVVILATLAAVLGAGALFAGTRALLRKQAKPDKAQEKNNGQRCFDVKKLVEEKLKELTDLRGQLEDKAHEAAREKIQEAARGTSAEELLVRIAQGETAYKRLKQLYEKCVIEFGTKERVLVVGASLSGKAALVEYFRSKKYNSPVEEMEEQLAQKNGGVFPAKSEERHKLVSEIVNDVFGRKKILFFTNTDYLTTDDLRAARKNGFAIIQLSLESAELQKRNELVDKVVDANQATEEVAAELVDFLE